mmetsp:Transcript_13059/g.26496  ORF Transcript_13059/g.26496 Transcript_13059/m.26496 type:complete len:201 (-) Transcript_13059:131-733(-)
MVDHPRPHQGSLDLAGGLPLEHARKSEPPLRCAGCDIVGRPRSCPSGVENPPQPSSPLARELVPTHQEGHTPAVPRRHSAFVSRNPSIPRRCVQFPYPRLRCGGPAPETYDDDPQALRDVHHPRPHQSHPPLHHRPRPGTNRQRAGQTPSSVDPTDLACPPRHPSRLLMFHSLLQLDEQPRVPCVEQCLHNPIVSLTHEL